MWEDCPFKPGFSAGLGLLQVGSEVLAGSGQFKHGTPRASDADPVEGR